MKDGYVLWREIGLKLKKGGGDRTKYFQDGERTTRSRDGFYASVSTQSEPGSACRSSRSRLEVLDMSNDEPPL